MINKRRLMVPALLLPVVLALHGCSKPAEEVVEAEPAMAPRVQVLLVAQVEDAATWEPAFRTHAEMFRNTGVISSPIRFGIGEDNTVAILEDVTSVADLLASIEGEENQAAMSADRVKKDTVRIIPLDKSLAFGQPSLEEPHVIAITIAQVEDSAMWEQKFRTHTDLFAATENVMSPIRYGMGDDNHVAVYEEVRNFDDLVASNASEETQAAMAGDGVKSDTVKVFKIDKELTF